MSSVAYIRTVDGITVAVNGVPYNVSSEHTMFTGLITAINTGAPVQDIEDILTAMARKIEEKVKLSQYMEYSGGVVLYKGEVLGGYAVDKLIALVEEGHDVLPLALFLEKLQQNPSNQTVENLYQFLEYGRMPITKEGNFLAYKAVRADYKDIHSGTMDNGIGKTCTMPRTKVDDRRDVTCSHGLHVCSFEYLPSFAHANGHVMICEINPANVVAIPSDYNNTKMRVSEYKVVGELEGYYKDHKDVLGGNQVWDPEYTLYGRNNDNEEWALIDEADTVEDLEESLKVELEFATSGEAVGSCTQFKIVDSAGITVAFRRL